MNESLINFNSPQEYFLFLKKIGIVGKWKIEDGRMNNRGKSIIGKSYCQKLVKLFEEKDLFRKKVSVAEVISWLDSFQHVSRILNRLETLIEEKFYSDISITFEYVIPFSKKSRVDCIIGYKGNICLIEFRTVDSFDKIRKAYEKKITELIIYKELFSNFMNKNKVIVYPFIGIYEYKFKSLIEKNQNYLGASLRRRCSEW